MNESGYLSQIWIYDGSNKKVQKYLTCESPENQSEPEYSFARPGK